MRNARWKMPDAAGYRGPKQTLPWPDCGKSAIKPEKYGQIRKEKVLTNRQGLFYNEMYF
ncbi:MULTISPECIES: hypothetical protein [Clostridia]|uniref:hypothetical protein n=1 Tax=Clostridia TaxID=186801 RepID=UPI0012EDFDB1|nr:MULTISPECIES: hypothetical protein [Clostridia]